MPAHDGKALSQTHGRGSRWMIDGAVTAGRAPRYRTERGLTVLELLVAMAVFAIAAAVAIPTMPRGAYALWGANQQLLGDFRLTRSDALTKGDHFRLDVVSGTTYQEYRLAFVGGVWVPSGAPVRMRTLPPGISFVGGVGLVFEFNTRGLLLNPGAAATLTLQDTYSGHTRSVTVWPSGQVAPV